jgi:hypothetical protein
VLGYTTMGLLTLWTFWFVRKRRREGNARRAAAAEQELSHTEPQRHGEVG